MIRIEPITRTNDKHCSACAYYRKPNYESLTFIRLAISTSRDSNAIVLSFCNECAKELMEKLGETHG